MGKTKRKPLWFRLIRNVALGFVALVVVYVFGGAWVIRSGCVVLPNGMLIGREAYIDPDRYFWNPIVVLKYPDGSVALSDWVEDFYFSETTVYGGTLNGIIGRDNPAYRPDVFFAYRPDVGLVYRHEDPETYRRLKEEAGPLIWVMKRAGATEVHTNLLGTYLELKKDRANRRSFCPLRILPGRRPQS
jgi:hypothetical protein